VVAKVRKGSKQAVRKFNVERFNLRKLNELEVKKEYHIKISNSSAVLENLNDSEEINRSEKNIKGNIQTSDKDSRVL